MITQVASNGDCEGRRKREEGRGKKEEGRRL
jgi:hypothetical protein